MTWTSNTRNALYTLIFLSGTLVSGQAIAGAELSAEWQYEIESLGGGSSNIRFDIVVSNTGDAAATDVWFELFIGAGDSADTTSSVDSGIKESIAAGGEHYLTLNSGPLVPGVYTADALIDSLEMTAETNEEDNLLSTQVTISKAPKGYIDLEVTDLDASVADSNVLFTATVKNNGTVASSPFSVDVFCGSGTAPSLGYHGYPYRDAEPLQPGESAAVEFQLVNKLAGTIPCFAVVDAVQVIPETEEDNNVFGPYVLTVPEFALSPLGDIVVLDVTPVVEPSGTITYQSTFLNAGSDPVSNFRAQIFYNTTEAPEFGLFSGDSNFDFIVNDTFNQVLLPGATRLVNWKWENAPNPGAYEAWVYADTNNVYAEANENNNVYGPVSVDLYAPPGKSDLIVESVSHVVEGYSVRYTATIRNNGDATPGGFDVDIFAESSDEPSVTDGALSDAYTTVASGPAPGQTMDVEILWNDAVQGSYLSWAVVDAFQQVTEKDENNNGFGPIAVEIEAVGGPELTIKSFEGEVIGGNGVFTVFIENQGTIDAGAFDISLYTSGSTEPTEESTPDETQRVNEGLAVDEEAISVTLNWENVPAGTHSIWVAIDSDNEVEEANENNNLEGPVVLSLDEANCPDGAFLESQCICGSTAQQTGYCCDGVWAALPCDLTEVIEVNEDEPSDEDVTEPEEEEDDASSASNISAPESGDSGCSHSSTGIPFSFALLFLMGWIRSGLGREESL